MKFFAVLLLIILGACANLVKEPSQPITVRFKDPDAPSARCILETKDTRHQLNVPGTIRVERSRKPLRVYCATANGDKGEEFHKARLNQRAAWNIANGYIGLPYDMITSLAYGYPNEIIIDYDASKDVVLKTPPPLAYGELSE